MDKKFIRTESLLGADAMNRLNNSRIAVFGVGGVGSYVLEALVRSGVGNIDIFDNDTVCESNLNRQLIATMQTIGMKKADVAKERALSINPKININVFDVFYLPETADNIDLSVYDYIVDAIDTVTAKLELILRAKNNNVPIISVMGTGNKLDPTLLRVDDINKTYQCPLAKVMRYELKKRGVRKLKTVWSPEPALKPGENSEIKADGRTAPGSTAFVPGTAGLIAAAEVIKDIIK